MYARSTTIHGDPMKLDDGITYVREEVMQALQQMPGCIGLSMLCERETGRCIVTSAWRDEMAMHDTEGAVHDMRRRAAEMLGGRAEVQEWEIALMHRMHEAHNGACTRVIWASVDPAKFDDDLSTFRMSLLPKMEEQLTGFCSVSHMINRDTGRSATSVTYDSREDMMRANERATALREEFVRAIGMEITDMAEFDLVVAHLRVPEMV
jgi:quinol monooxygenase YgiN